MKYVEYTFTFKNGIKEVCRLEIEPHEINEKMKGLADVNKTIHACLKEGLDGAVTLPTVDGQFYIGMGEVQSVQIEGLEELVVYAESRMN